MQYIYAKVREEISHRNKSYCEYVPRNIRRERKFLLSLTGRLKGWGRGRRLYWMVGRSIHKLLRTWFGLLINVLKREESACAAISLKEGASSGRNPPRLARRMKLSRRLRSRSLEYPHQAGEPYTKKRRVQHIKEALN